MSSAKNDFLILTSRMMLTETHMLPPFRKDALKQEIQHVCPCSWNLRPSHSQVLIFAINKQDIDIYIKHCRCPKAEYLFLVCTTQKMAKPKEIIDETWTRFTYVKIFGWRKYSTLRREIKNHPLYSSSKAWSDILNTFFIHMLMIIHPIPPSFFWRKSYPH